MSQSSPFVPRFIGSNFKNFLLGGARDREVRATAELYARARRAYKRYPLATQQARDRYITDIMFEVAEEFTPLPCRPLIFALGDLAESLLTLDGLGGIPEIASIETLSIEESITLRAQLWRLLRFVEDWDRLSTIWRTKLVILCQGILHGVPASARGTYQTEEDSTAASMSIPLIDLCPDPATVIARTMATLYDDDVVGSHLFEIVREQFERNLCAASGVPYERRGDTSKSVVPPGEYQVESNEQLVGAYLGATPFAAFFSTRVPFSIPLPVRFEHIHILAGSGHGKTQTLQHLILSDLTRPEPPGLVIIDSQGDMIRKISRLALFDGGRRAGTKAHHHRSARRGSSARPQHVRRELGAHGPLRNAADREQILNGVIELYEYFFGSLLGAELTQKQSVIFRYLARLMITIPGRDHPDHD